jgi:hypothetical protein
MSKSRLDIFGFKELLVFALEEIEIRPRFILGATLGN